MHLTASDTLTLVIAVVALILAILAFTGWRRG